MLRRICRPRMERIMNRSGNSFVAIAAVALMAMMGLSTFAADATSRPPNIVLFLADDLGWADVPWHGSPYKLPHLATLAQQSVRLESHYVHPMCSPTRAAFMTGRY